MSRRRLLFALALLAPLGFSTKLYGGPGAGFVAGYLGGVFYVVFWVYAVLLARPKWRTGRVAAAVLAATCMIEVLQLWHPPPLEAVRANPFGAVLLGETFSWGDFPCYLAGALLAVALGSALRVQAQAS